MKYFFFGTPEFAAVILEKLIVAKYPPVAVICNPDRPVGRKKVITSSPTKRLALNYNNNHDDKTQIIILQPEKINEDVKGQLSKVNCQLAVVAAYAKIIPKEIIELFPRGVIGVHPSLLPRHRGSSPIQQTILDGDTETGVTLYLLDEKVDHGPIVSSVKCQVLSEDTYESLLKKLAGLGGDLLAETLPKFLVGEIIKPVPQNEAEATYTKKFTSEDAFIDEKDLDEALAGTNPEKATAIERKIRALNPEPGAWTMQGIKGQGSGVKNEKRVKLLEAAIESGRLVLKKIQEEGGRSKILAR